MEKKKVFLSLPMRGYTNEQIEEHLKKMKDVYSARHTGEEFEFVDNFIQDDISEDGYKNIYMAYLANAILKMAECDVIFFGKGFEEARGCLSEDYIAAHYDMHREYEEEEDDKNLAEITCSAKEYIYSTINAMQNLDANVKKYLKEKHMEMNTPTVEIRYHSDKFPIIEGYKAEEHGNFIDLSTAEDIHIEPMSPAMINLGVSMKIPKGYWGQLVPRSSTFKKYHIIQTNSFGVIDTEYCGDNDIWMLPVFNLSNDTVYIPAGTRVCQFRIVKDNPMDLVEVAKLDGPDRGGFGSTGN